MMQRGNRFLDFANEIMARHRGLGFEFEPAAMLHLEEQQNMPEQAATHQSFTTNLYHIRNIKEENYLFKQNLSFLTQVLENKMYQNLYPSVEKQIEKVIREEMPQTETRIINSVSRQLLKLVQQGGVEQFEVVREKVLSEYREKEKEKIILKEQEKLFHKIENILNSSVYQRVEIVHPEIQHTESLELKKTENVLEHTLRVVEAQNQIFANLQNQSIGNLGTFYENILHSPVTEKVIRTQISEREMINAEMRQHTVEQIPLEYIQEQTFQSPEEIFEKVQQADKLTYSEIQKQIERQQVKSHEKIIERLQNKVHRDEHRISVRQNEIHLEYPSEETTQYHQEVIQMLHSELQRIPQVPKILQTTIENQVEEVVVPDSRTQMIEKTKSISEQILSRVENIINLSLSESNTVVSSSINKNTNLISNTVTKTVALNKLSHAILEYAESKTTPEQLQTNMLRIMEDYHREVFSVPGVDTVQMVYNNNAETITIEKLKNNINRRMIQSIHKQGSAPALIQAMEPAAIVYRSEESAAPEQLEKTRQLEKQVKEIVKTVKNVEHKTIVHKEKLVEEQKKVVHEVLKNNPAIFMEGESAGYIQKEVQQSVEEQMNQSVNQIANRVYRRLEDKLKSERGRRGLI